MTRSVAGSLVLLLSLSALLDERRKVVPVVRPLYYSLTMLAVGLALSTNCGVGLNPARDLAPRLVTSVLGWGLEVLTVSSLLSVLSSHAGGLAGVWLYRAVLSPATEDQRRKTRSPVEPPRKEFRHSVQIRQNEVTQERTSSLVNLYTEEAEVRSTLTVK